MNETDIVKNLVKYCPHCGHNGEKTFIDTLPNGGCWVCDNCEERVEAYLLDR